MRYLLPLACALLLACNADGLSPTDLGVPDSSASDSGARDLRAGDEGVIDSGASDALAADLACGLESCTGPTFHGCPCGNPEGVACSAPQNVYCPAFTQPRNCFNQCLCFFGDKKWHCCGDAPIHCDNPSLTALKQGDFCCGPQGIFGPPPDCELECGTMNARRCHCAVANIWVCQAMPCAGDGGTP